MRELNDWAKRELFISGKLDEADPIWGQTAQVYESAIFGWVVLGDRCGSFRCTPSLRQILQGWSAESKAHLTSWVTERNRTGEEFPALTDDVLVAARERRALRFGAKVDRFFAYLNERRYRVGQPLWESGSVETADSLATKQTIMRWIEAAHDGEFWGFMNAIKSAGLVSNDSNRWLLTAEGLLRLDALTDLGAANDQAFVAMWFGAEMTEAYENGIVPGLAEAGYRAFRIDQKEHSNKIDDEIIAEIRRSRFVVADFTCGIISNEGSAVGIPRGGVYYEAGFAQGLNIPVIWTVREDQINLVHFDTRQFNHITWTDPADLRVKLYRRVAAVLGHFSSTM